MMRTKRYMLGSSVTFLIFLTAGCGMGVRLGSGTVGAQESPQGTTPASPTALQFTVTGYNSIRSALTVSLGEATAGYFSVGSTTGVFDRVVIQAPSAASVVSAITVGGTRHGNYSGTLISTSGTTTTFQISGIVDFSEKFCISFVDANSTTRGFRMKYLPCDYDQNGVVANPDINNYAAANFGTTIDDSATRSLKEADVDQNWSFNLTDISTVAARFGTGLPSSNYTAPCQ